MRRLVIVDVSNFIFRAFFAIRPLHAPDGTPVNAVYGVLTMLHRLMEQHTPTHLACARDTKEASFRKEIYADYKANRSEPPDDLIPQFALIEELMGRMGFPTIAMPGYEADDIIGCLVRQYHESFDEILIASGDKDLMQFVDDKVKMLDTMKDKIYGPADVEEKMGVPPHQIVDYLALIGDSSDNIPGVPGIGPKGAAGLLKEFDTLENCITHLDEIKNKKCQTALRAHVAEARLSKELATIKCDLDLPLPVDKLEFTFKPDGDLRAFLERMGFKSFLAKILHLMTSDVSSGVTEAVETPSVMSEDKRPLMILTSPAALRNYLAASEGMVHLHAEFEDELDPFSPLRALAFSQKNGHAIALVADNEKAWWGTLSASARPVTAWELKPIWLRFLRWNLAFPPHFDDIAQLHFVLSPEGRQDMDTLSRELTGVGLPELLPIEGQGDLLTPAVFDTTALSARSRLLELAYEPLLSKVRSARVERPYRELDLPLLRVLASMELTGILLDSSFYAGLESEFTNQTTTIEGEVETLAGHPVNLKSPKQIAQLLFEELKLPALKKTKTGFSTDVDVLEELAAMKTSPIPEMLLRYREVEKLNSTYVRVLPKLVNPVDGRIHTHFRPGNAATGRLSSDNPNLQNIPVRTENGRRLRQGFVASPGTVLVSADYSQVELRILAHFSEDPVMLEAFRTGKDIHIQTAAEIFGVPLDQVSKDQRNAAKGINFGLMYGQSSFGLSQALRIPQSQAKDYITNYFRRFGNIKAYLDSLKEFAEANGYAETMFGRKRFLPDIRSQNRQTKAMAERMAINSPIQGTAADIIKLAMLHLQEALVKGSFTAKLLLQVHDELILEAPPAEVETLIPVVRECMEGAVTLRTPLKVDVGTGADWYGLK